MLAELDQVRGRPARWAFALGAARACLMAPRAVRPAWHAIVVAGAAAAAGGAIHALAPGAGVIAAAVIPGLPALCVLAVLARRPAGHVSAAGRVIQVIAVAAIAACAVLALRQDVLYPPPAAGRGGWAISLLLAAGLTGYVWLALRRPPASACLAARPRPRARRHPGVRPVSRSPLHMIHDQPHRQGDGPCAAGTTDGDARRTTAIQEDRRVAPMHCCTGAPSDPYVPLVAAYGSSKP